MTVQESPFGTYADVTGVVDATAAPEIAAMITSLSDLIPDPRYASLAPDSSGQSPAATPDFDAIRPEYAEKLLLEIEALAAAIAAAPTS
jgi:hypothetical protein